MYKPPMAGSRLGAQAMTDAAYYKVAPPRFVWDW